MRRASFLAFFTLTLALGAWSAYRLPMPLKGAEELLRAVAALVLLLGGMAALGRSLLNRFHVFSFSLSEEALVSLALGAGAVSALVFVLGHFGGLSPLGAWLGLMALWIALFGHLEHFLQELRGAIRSKRPWEGSGSEALVLLAGALGVAAVLALCLAPPSFYDALVYHLALPMRAVASGSSLPLEGNLYSWLPGAGERLWTLCLLLLPGEAGIRMAGLLNFCFALATGLALADAASRFHSPSRQWLAAALLFCQPLIALSFGVFGSDGLAVFYSFLSLVAFLAALGQPSLPARRGQLMLAFLLAGMGVAVKPVAATHLAVLAVLALWSAWKDPFHRKPGLWLACLGLSVLPLLPWMARNLALEGQPILPFGLSLFGAEIFRPESASYLAHLQTYGAGLPGWLLPLGFFMPIKGANLGGGGQLGFLTLAALPWALHPRLRAEARWLAAYLALGFGAWCLGPHVVRYAIPGFGGLVLLTSMVFAAAEDWAVSRGWALALRALVLGGLVLGGLQTWAVVVKDFDPLAVSLGLRDREDYLVAQGVQYARAADWLKTRAPRARLLLLGESRSAYLPPHSTSATVFEPHPFKAWLTRAATPEDLDAILTQKGYDFALVNRAEMARLGLGAGFDYFAAPDRRALFEAWLNAHAASGWHADGVDLFELH